MRVSAGGSTTGGTHGLGRGFVAKMFPGDRGITSALSHFLANLSRDLPAGFAIGLLS